MLLYRFNSDEESVLLKVALIGYGKMGRAIEAAAQLLEVEVVARISHTSMSEEWDKISHAEVCIDFTAPHAVLDNIRRLAPYRKPLVLGTSGWYHQLNEVQALVEEYNLGVVYLKSKKRSK